MTLDIRHIKHFVAVAEELHFARAAARIGIEQSPLSQSIRDLEARLGVRLFNRTTCGTTVTQTGELLLTDARQVLALIERIRRAARAMATGKAGHLRIGLCTDLLTDRIAQILRLCREEFPDLELSVTDITDHIASLTHLRSGATDLCFASAHTDDPDIASVELGTEPLVAWLPSSESQRLAPVIHIRRSTAEVLVTSGLGAALVPSSFLPSDITNTTVSQPHGAVPPATVWATYRRDDDAPAIRRLIELIKSQHAPFGARE